MGRIRLWSLTGSSGAFFSPALLRPSARCSNAFGDLRHCNLIIDFSAVPFVELDACKNHQRPRAQGRGARRLSYLLGVRLAERVARRAREQPPPLVNSASPIESGLG